MKNNVNEFRIRARINKEVLYKNLHIYEGTETFKNCEAVFSQLSDIISSMEIKLAYIFTDYFPLKLEENVDKYIICYVSAERDTNSLASDLISRGEYLKGYLLNEMVSHAIFKASDKMNNKIRNDIKKQGYKLNRRYAPGDGNLDLKYQRKFIEELEKHIRVEIYSNEHNVMVPSNSLTYIYTIVEGVDEEINTCFDCINTDCVYKNTE
ncbi:MAG TPA: hypothetical protein GX396_10325 [Tissierellia bacterium]|mgnify:CR=1 FL=1|jgi:uncharacterized protein YpbB|nr:hypothetical protein [Tissierellia bacterium]